MDYTEFRELYAKCDAAMRDYFVEAEKSCEMLGKCTAGPLSFRERMRPFYQETVEREALMKYLDSKRLLHSTALLGYGFNNLDLTSE